jgi:hypothetical protein
MARRFVLRVFLLVLASFVLVPAVARAQSVFTGTVKDTSGAVMPGVTVEAASPVLIEKVKTAITDESGLYRIVDLRPGIYTLTFTLPGFNTVTREGVELQSNFTATINIELGVGTLQESVTVSGASPVVDVSQNVKQQVLTREVLDAVPTAKTIQSIGQLVLGVTLNSPDVGGSRAMQQTYFAIRGTGGAQSVVLVDGLMTNGLMGDGAVQAYHNEAMSQEMVYQTAGGAAETLTGGITMNLVPKDGGNQFRGGAKWAKSPESWQGDNFTPELEAMGVTGVDKIKHFEEFNIEQGGPIIRNKLWFFGAFRQAYYDKPIANTFQTDGSLPYPQAAAACTISKNCEQGVSDEKMANPVARLTWQISERNKFAVYSDRALRLRGHAMGSLTDPNTASVIWNTPNFSTGSAKWTSTLSSSLLLEVGTSFNRERYDNLYQPGIYAERGTAAWYRNARKDDTSTGYLWNASSAQLGNYPDRYNIQGSISYVTGAHNVKFGVMDQFGSYRRYNNANADLYQTYQNGAPLRVTVLNTPLQVQENLDANFGIYAQDSWHLGKLTLNYGARFDYLKQRIVGQPAMVGRFANVAAYDDIVLPTWKDFSPRVSAVYNLWGEGKTAVRVGYNKFVTAQTTGFAQLYNPTALTTQQLAWTDVNGNDIADGERGCAGYPSVGCEINFAGLPSNFGVRSLAQFDPDLKRPYQLAFNAGITHEVMTGVTASFEYFRSDFRNITVRQNSLRTAASYDQFSVASPLDGSSINVWLPKPGVASQVANIDSTSEDMKRAYNGFDMSFNARMRGGVRAFGGFSLERTINDVCVSAASDPNRSLYCNQADSGIPWQKQFKATVLYPLPWYGISVSAALQSLNGYLSGTAAQAYGGFTAGTGFDNPRGLGTFWLVTPTLRYAANCNGACTPGALVLPAMQASGLASISVPLVAPETEFTPRINQLDFSVSKSIEFGAVRATPRLDLFNSLNSSDYTSVVSAQFGAATYMRPSTILQGRIIRIGVDVRW